MEDEAPEQSTGNTAGMEQSALIQASCFQVKLGWDLFFLFVLFFHTLSEFHSDTVANKNSSSAWQEVFKHLIDEERVNKGMFFWLWFFIFPFFPLKEF